MDFEVNYFYFDYDLILKCGCGRTFKAWGSNHTNTFKCKCYYLKIKVINLTELNNNSDKNDK